MWFESLIALGVKLYGLELELGADDLFASFLQPAVKISTIIIHKMDNSFRKVNPILMFPVQMVKSNHRLKFHTIGIILKNEFLWNTTMK